MTVTRALYCGGGRTLRLERPAVMGVVNLTPDSFSGDGTARDVSQAVARARALVEAGADLLDLGAESSRPGAQWVTVGEELGRLLPVLRELRDLRDAGVPISVDTCKPEVMEAALAGGASIINDIRALSTPGALQAVAGIDCAVCLMHMQGDPRTMQSAPAYVDVVAEVTSFLIARVENAVEAGIIRERCWIDPGFGFGKTFEHNVQLFKALPGFMAQGLPLVVGVSRKSMLGAITGRGVGDRLAPGLAAAVLAASAGAAVIRTHDVAATVDSLKTWRLLAPDAWGEAE